jgi:hypothetical protein
MDITTLAAWGELLGGIAVVVSLIYLALQIRQNSRLLRASGGSAAAQANFVFSTAIAQDEDLTRLYWDGLQDRADLTESDRRRFDMVISVAVAALQQQLSLAKDNLIDPDVWDSQIKAFQWVLRHQGALQWWNEYRGNSSDDFRD